MSRFKTKLGSIPSLEDTRDNLAAPIAPIPANSAPPVAQTLSQAPAAPVAPPEPVVESKDDKFISIRVDKHLRAEFKIEAAKRDMNLTQYVIAAHKAFMGHDS